MRILYNILEFAIKKTFLNQGYIEYGLNFKLLRLRGRICIRGKRFALHEKKLVIT